MFWILLYVLTGALVYLIARKHCETKVTLLKDFIFPSLGILFWPVVIITLFFDALITSKFEKDYYNSIKTEDERRSFLECLEDSKNDEEDDDD